jgi:hypothetical protein
VKPKLEWVPSDEFDNTIRSGKYAIVHYFGKWYAEHDGKTKLGDHINEDDAKAACERHWETQQ